MKNFTEEHIVRILKEVEAGAKVVETCRKHGISKATYYAWKSKYAGRVSKNRLLTSFNVDVEHWLPKPSAPSS